MHGNLSFSTGLIKELAFCTKCTIRETFEEINSKNVNDVDKLKITCKFHK